MYTVYYKDADAKCDCERIIKCERQYLLEVLLGIIKTHKIVTRVEEQ